MPIPNTNFTAADGQEYRYDTKLGEGGQADVWQITRLADGHKMALKLFKTAPAGAALLLQQQRLTTVSNVAKQIAQALPQSQACFPLTIYNAGGDFGVLMQLASGKPLDHHTLLTSPYDQPNHFVSSALRAVLAHTEKYYHFLLAGFYLARAIRNIHRHGMTHCDLSLGNVFFNSQDGSVCLIDCDNLACGKDFLPVKVAGTPGFRAPELITAAFPEPSPETDRHSLAVLLFYLVLFRHPFIGNTNEDFDVSDQTEAEAFGTGAVFTDHISNNSNRFTGGIPFASLPKSLQRMFNQVFTDGLLTPAKRPTAAAWAHEFWKALECMAECSHCQQRFFIADGAASCLFCGKTNPRKRWRLRFSNGQKLLAAHGRKLYEHHLANMEFQFQRPLALLEETVLGMQIKNLSSDMWTVHFASGSRRRCGHNFTFRLESVTAFEFSYGRVFIEPVIDEV